MKLSGNINFVELLKLSGVSPSSAKSIKTRIFKKLEINDLDGLIDMQSLQKIRNHYESSSNKSKYKDRITNQINNVMTSSYDELPDDLKESSNVLLKVDPFEAAFILPKLVEYIRENGMTEVLMFYEREVFNFKNFIK